MRLFLSLCALTLFLSSCLQNNAELSPAGTTVITGNRTQPVINEILFAPVQLKDDGKADQPDYIELFNPGSETVNLYGWYIQDCPAASGKRFSYYFADDPSGDNLLAPGQYGIIVPEESTDKERSRLVGYYDYLSGKQDVRIFIVERKTFSLNNDTDCVTLKDAHGTVIDSVSYNSGWHNLYITKTKGRSLEKFNSLLPSNDPESWSSSMDASYGGTPGKRNSVYLESDQLERSPSLSIDPAVFSPQLDGSGEKATIQYRLPAGAYQIAAVLYDSSGRIVKTLAKGLPAGPEGSFEWNGLRDNGTPAPSGLYLARVSVSGTTLSGTLYLEGTVAIVR